MNGVAAAESYVVFTTREGVEHRGTPVHVARDTAVFEIYDASSALQLSEVLERFGIVRKDRAVYDGRAVITNIVPAGTLAIVSVTLTTGWSHLPGANEFRNRTADFVREWQSAYSLRPEYRLAVNNIRTFLRELNDWLSQFEVVLSSEQHDDRSELAKELTKGPVNAKLDELVEAFQDEASQVPRESESLHQAFARREIHPLALCAPFVNRAYTKPLGHAGDFEVVKMMLRDPFEGSNTYAKYFNAFNLGHPPPQAHRNRIGMIASRLSAEARRSVRTDRKFRILNVGCGPADEICRYIRNESPEIVNASEFDLIDFSSEALTYVAEEIKIAKTETGKQPTVNLIHKSIQNMLRAASSRCCDSRANYDMVYCAGLFDYISDRVCTKLMELFFELANSDGLILVTNVHPSNPNRYYMEHILQWYLVHRNENQMLALAPQSRMAEIDRDPTGVNVFLQIRKETC